MVLMCQFFFSNRKVIHHRYKQFFEVEQTDRETDDTGVDETPQISPKESTSRFYFTLQYEISGQDVTKFEQIEQMSVYLILNISSLMKDRRIKEQNELRQLQSQTKHVR